MLKSVIGPIAVVVALTSQNLNASDLTVEDSALLQGVQDAKLAASILLECSSKKDQKSCSEVQLMTNKIQQTEQWIIQSKAVVHRELEVVQQASLSDEKKIQQLEDIHNHKPKSAYHYQQIITFAKHQLAGAAKALRPLIAIVPEIERINQSMLELLRVMQGKNPNEVAETLAQNQNLVLLNLEKWTMLQKLLHAALNAKPVQEDDRTLALIIKRAREGSVVYQIPASSPKVSGMLPFRCEDETKSKVFNFCERDVPSIRFDVDLINKVLGGLNGAAVQIVFEKAWAEKINLGDVLLGLIYDNIKPDVQKGLIHISYYETHTCSKPNGPEVNKLLSPLLCNNEKPIVSRHPSRGVIEKTLFDMLNISNESLKLYAAE